MDKAPQYLLDSSFLIALLDASDTHHGKATQLFAAMQEEQAEIFISDILINEVLSVFAKRCEAKEQDALFPKFCKDFRKAIEDYPILCLYELVSQYYREITRVMTRYEGQLNFHDALIVLFLKEVPRVCLVSFDQDFFEVKNLCVMS